MTDDWFWAAIICVAPVAGFGILELFGAIHRKRLAANSRGTRVRGHRR